MQQVPLFGRRLASVLILLMLGMAFWSLTQGTKQILPSGNAPLTDGKLMEAHDLEYTRAFGSVLCSLRIGSASLQEKQFGFFSVSGVYEYSMRHVRMKIKNSAQTPIDGRLKGIMKTAITATAPGKIKNNMMAIEDLVLIIEDNGVATRLQGKSVGIDSKWQKIFVSDGLLSRNGHVIEAGKMSIPFEKLSRRWAGNFQ